jgi:hypothetical protein
MAIPSDTQRSRLRELNSNLPRLDWVTVALNGAQHRLPFCFRKGTNGPALLFYGIKEMRGFVNIEGNLAAEDCIFSRRVAAHSFDELSATLFDQIQTELRSSTYAGDRMIAHNLALNTNIRAYYAYSFETVRESDSGRLLDEYLNLPVPKLFLYGEANKTLSYLPALRASSVKVCEIPRSAHFLFYDDPVATFEEIGRFVNRFSE